MVQIDADRWEEREKLSQPRDVRDSGHVGSLFVHDGKPLHLKGAVRIEQFEPDGCKVQARDKKKLQCAFDRAEKF